MRYVWESIVIDWVDEWKVWSICGVDSEGNSEWLTQCYRQRDAVDEAAHYAFDESEESCRAEVIEVYTKQGKLKKTYTRESYNSTRFWERHERAYMVSVETRVLENYVVAAKSQKAVRDQFQNDRSKWTSMGRVEGPLRLIQVREIAPRRIK